MRQGIFGAALVVVTALVGWGVYTLAGFRADYLKVRAEHAVMYNFLAGVVTETSDKKPVARAQILDAWIKQSLQPKKD